MDVMHQIILSPKTDVKNLHEFFGIYGSLPMSYTERFLYIEKEIRSIFILILKLIPKIAKTFNYATILPKTPINQTYYFKTYEIHQDFNLLNKSKLGFFILGKKIIAKEYANLHFNYILGNNTLLY